MRNRSTILAVVFCTVLAVSAAAGVACCSGEPGYANAIAEDMLVAVNEGDYNAFKEHIAYKYWSDIPEEDFDQQVADIHEEYGTYQTKTFWKVEVKDPFTAVFYKATFTKSEEVVVKVVFENVLGEIRVSGFRLDPAM